MPASNTRLSCLTEAGEGHLDFFFAYRLPGKSFVDRGQFVRRCLVASAGELRLDCKRELGQLLRRSSRQVRMRAKTPST
jgi:hypothetical protein